MGRELARQLVAEACNVAMCDVSPIGLAETQRLCEAAICKDGFFTLSKRKGRIFQAQDRAIDDFTLKGISAQHINRSVSSELMI